MGAVQEDLGNGWLLSHRQEASSLASGGPGAATITITPGNFTAHKRLGDQLVEQTGESMEQLKERIDYWEATRAAPNPGTPDGNRELSESEKLESANATVMQMVTYGARPSAEVDLTPAPEKAKAKAATLSVTPQVEQEELSDEEAVAVHAAATGTPAAPPEAEKKAAAKPTDK